MTRVMWKAGRLRTRLCGGLVVRGLDRSDLGLFLGDAFRQHGLELDLLLLLLVQSAALEGVQVTAALETDGSNETLDLWRFGIRLSTLLLRTRNLPSYNVLPHIILLAQIEELPDLRSPLGAQSLRQHIIRQPRDIVITLLDDYNREDGDVWSNDASTDGFALTFTSAASAVA